MLAKLRWGWILALLFLAAAISLEPSYAQQEAVSYFPETGHWVKGDFLTAYASVSNPSLIFGNPITGEFQTQTVPNHSNLTVQYFQRSRFEYHPENPEELRVILTNLGELLYELEQPGVAVAVPTNFPSCRYFNETDHHVCYAFLDFFDAYGGIAQFGYPISEIEIRDRRLVQYFQRARFEWHPELPSGQRVKLTDLGDLYFDLYENAEYRNPEEIDNNVPSPVLDLKVYAFIEKAVIRPGLMQEIYVIVRDQRYRAVANAQVVFTIILTDGSEDRYIMPLTDIHGLTTLEFPTQSQVWGTAEIAITVTYDQFQKQTRTSYRIWW
jgi:hypothetical protein